LPSSRSTSVIVNPAGGRLRQAIQPGYGPVEPPALISSARQEAEQHSDAESNANRAVGVFADGAIGGFGARNGCFLNMAPGFPALFNGSSEPLPRFNYFFLRNVCGGGKQILGIFNEAFRWLGQFTGYGMRFHNDLVLCL